MTAIKAPDSVEDFVKRVTHERQDMPGRLQQCADYLVAHTDEIAFATVAELSNAAGVQPSALMRFCQMLGFSGYTDMQKLFRTQIQPGLPDYSVRISNLRKGGAGSPSAMLAEFVDAGRLSLEKLSASVNSTVLEQAVNKLSSAHLIHVVGLRRAFPVASYLAYAFEKLNVPAMLHDGSGRLTHSTAMQPGDAVIAITFAPYSTETIDLAENGAKLGLPVVVISDSIVPNLHSDPYLALKVSEIDFGAFRSLSASLSLAMSIAVSVGTKRSEKPDATAAAARRL